MKSALVSSDGDNGGDDDVFSLVLDILLAKAAVDSRVAVVSHI